jgi:nucleoside-diphosphate-sugar epimerase
VGHYERNLSIDTKVPARPDSLYGVSKTFGDNLASFYFDRFGIESVRRRIGTSIPGHKDRRHRTGRPQRPRCQVSGGYLLQVGALRRRPAVKPFFKAG